eukprot:Nk52_evm18s2192 gene=Nk52_evmTU18s2192
MSGGNTPKKQPNQLDWSSSGVGEGGSRRGSISNSQKKGSGKGPVSNSQKRDSGKGAGSALKGQKKGSGIGTGKKSETLEQKVKRSQVYHNQLDKKNKRDQVGDLLKNRELKVLYREELGYIVDILKERVAAEEKLKSIRTFEDIDATDDSSNVRPPWFHFGRTSH